MEVLLENNPVIDRIWKEWLEKDKKLSQMTKEERLDYCMKYQWLFPKKKPGKMVELEALYSSVTWRYNREQFHRWFYVVCGYMFSRVHFGDNSYYQYKKIFKKQFRREKCTSDDFPSQVLLVLGMLGYITKLELPYSYTPGGKNNHGYHYQIDKEKLMTWGCPDVDDGGYTKTSTISSFPEWVMNKTSTISFQEEGEDNDRVSWTMHPDWLSEKQYQSISSVKVVKEGLIETSNWLFNYDDYQYFYHLSDKEQEDMMKTWVSYQKLRDLDCGIIGGCKDDSDRYAGRFYTPITNMKGEDRKFLRLDGELVTEVDVSNAQPTFLGIMMYRETGVVSEWLRQSLDGRFYEWIMEKTNSTEDRKTIKNWMMKYLYSCYQPNVKKDYDKPHKPHKPTKKEMEKDGPYLDFEQRLNKFLKMNEPAIFNKIDWYKRHPEYREDKDIYKYFEQDTGEMIRKKVGKGKWCSKLSYYLVLMEVEYIKRCIHALPEDMKFWTIHDCICVPESRSQEVKSIMEKVSREMYGDEITLKLKRENISKDCS